MMKKFLKTVKAEYGVDDKALKDGVYFHIPNTNLELLVRPATLHNTAFMKKQLEFDFEKKYGKGWENKLVLDENIRKDLADLYYPEVIVDYRYHDTKAKELGEEITLEDIVDLFGSAPNVFNKLALFVVDYKNFQLVGETEAKN